MQEFNEITENSKTPKYLQLVNRARIVAFLPLGTGLGSGLVVGDR